MLGSDSETDPDIIRATYQDPRNTVLNVEKQADLGLATSGVNPGLTAGQGGWVSTNTNETVVVPGAFSTDPTFIQGNQTGTQGGTGEDPTGTGDGSTPEPRGGYVRHKEPPGDFDPNFDELA